jgi:hypothetical protein
MPGILFDDPRWDAILDDFRSSGLTHAEFCRQRRLPLATFRRRLYHERATRATAGQGPPASTPGFLPITVLPNPTPASAAPHRPLELILPHGRRLAIAPGFDPETLRRLLSVLEGPPCSD